MHTYVQGKRHPCTPTHTHTERGPSGSIEQDYNGIGWRQKGGT